MKPYFQLFYRLIGGLGTLFTAYFSYDKNFDLAVKVPLILTVIFCGVMIIYDSIISVKNKPFIIDKKKKNSANIISNYLVTELNSANQVAIFARDLTWVCDNNQALETLKEKSKKNELTIFINETTDIVNTLINSGARVYEYSDESNKGFAPKSRFTILDYGGVGERVMIGAPRDRHHSIRHHNSDNFEVINLASDFIELLKTTSKKLQ